MARLNTIAYPELQEHAQRIANAACSAINQSATLTQSAMPYKSQFILERVISILQARV